MVQVVDARRSSTHRHLTRQAHRRSRQAIFDQIHTLGDAIGNLHRRHRPTNRVRSSRHQEVAAIQHASRSDAPHGASPTLLAQLLSSTICSRCWKRKVRSLTELLYEIKLRGLYRQLLPSGAASGEVVAAPNDAKVVTLPPVPEPTTAPTTTIATVPRAVDRATGWTISPIVAASLCIKPRGLLTPRQAAKA